MHSLERMIAFLGEKNLKSLMHLKQISFLNFILTHEKQIFSCQWFPVSPINGFYFIFTWKGILFSPWKGNLCNTFLILHACDKVDTNWPVNDDKVAPREANPAAEICARDGLAHLFESAEGSPIPSTLASIPTSFFVFEVPKGYMGDVIRVFAAFLFSVSDSFKCLKWLISCL